MIPLITSPHHELHRPETEYSHGRAIPYAEQPIRLQYILDSLLPSGLVQPLAPDELVPLAELETIHRPDYLAFLQMMSEQVENGRYVYPETFPVAPHANPQARQGHWMTQFGQYAIDPVAPIGRGTWAAAHLSATIAATGARLLMEGAPTAYALCRPPGHHAGRATLGGYCYLNNAALAAHLLKKQGKVAIIDVDYHHGNGTQEIFWDDPEVLFTSIHGHPNFDYPFFWGYEDERGAAGNVHNWPLPKGTTGREFMHTLGQLLEVVEQFNPQTVVISLGFDTYAEDPVGNFQLQLPDYMEIGQMLAQVKRPVLLVQEGGYASPMLGRMAENFLQGWLKA